MAKEEKVLEKLRSLGVEPLENGAIIVQYAPENLSAKVASFLLDQPFYILQICKSELLMMPLSWSGNIKNKEPLIIKYSEIQNTMIEESGFNYRVVLTCSDGNIELITQQKELAVFRSSGTLANENFWGTKNWHIRNLDPALKLLTNLTN